MMIDFEEMGKAVENATMSTYKKEQFKDIHGHNDPVDWYGVAKALSTALTRLIEHPNSVESYRRAISALGRYERAADDTKP